MAQNIKQGNRRKKMLFRSWHRGTREIDLLLGRFADEHIAKFTDSEIQQYEELLTNNDLDIYNWITGKEKPSADVDSAVLQKLINFYGL